MEVCHCGQRLIDHRSLCVHLLSSKLFVDHLPYRDGATCIGFPAAAYYFSFWFYLLWLKSHLGSYLTLLELQCRSELTGVCVTTVSQPGVDAQKCRWFGLIVIESPRAKVIVQPRLAGVEKVREMITKSGYSKLQLTRAWTTFNLHVLLKKYPAA